MGCVKPDGSLEPAARGLVRALRTPRAAEELAQVIGYPLYRVRSTLRELVQAGLVTEAGTGYALTDEGRRRAGEPG